MRGNKGREVELMKGEIGTMREKVGRKLSVCKRDRLQEKLNSITRITTAMRAKISATQ